MSATRMKKHGDLLAEAVEENRLGELQRPQVFLLDQTGSLTTWFLSYCSDDRQAMEFFSISVSAWGC